MKSVAGRFLFVFRLLIEDGEIVSRGWSFIDFTICVRLVVCDDLYGDGMRGRKRKKGNCAPCVREGTQIDRVHPTAATAAANDENVGEHVRMRACVATHMQRTCSPRSRSR